MSIIKRKKRDQYFIMSNHAAQQNLTSLNAIGLLAYIKSLPEDWILYKTYLQKKFTRRTVDNAWKELVEAQYIAGFSCYVDRKKSYYYLANDEPLTQEEFNTFIEETVEEIEAEGFTPKNLQPINDCKFTVVQNVQHKEISNSVSTVQNVQHLECSTTSTAPEVLVQRSNNKEIKQINNTNEIDNNIVNNIFAYKVIIKDQFIKEGDNLFSNDEILYFSETILEELATVPKDPEAYFNSVVKSIVYRRKRKLGIAPTVEMPIYNWLDA